MRFIREIISEKRRTAPVETSHPVWPDAGAPDAAAPDAEAWDDAQRRSADPLPLDAYELARHARVEDAELDAEVAFGDGADEQVEEETSDLLPYPADDEADAQEEDFHLALHQDDRSFDDTEMTDGESDEDDLADLDIFAQSDIRQIPDPFERLAKERVQQSVAAVASPPFDGDGNADPDVSLVVVGRAPQADTSAHRMTEEPLSVAVPAPAAGRGSNRSGRVKTRLLGFSTGSLEQTDMFAESRSVTADPFPVGWLVVVSELGRGASFALQDGVSKVGRGTDQTVCLNFGDNSISRDNHLSIAYDSEQNKFFIGHSGKSNLVRLNNKPLLSTEELISRDQIRLGETTLRFIALCENDFTWHAPDEKARKHG
ncbi:MAG: hypothetical protein COW54_07820 [Rhodobacteraceae bacterium CG17_big_fil_post_rev_8_21_14_2_50_63_15]|nr:FHA domain-containing protein [Roseovarius sp.]PIV78704.1 MAG: hypothetical protein COW54_07820 [Rhodobacteraceae bacterium CG17_big_fil_post_rev_8_21_14_2_50_63_15]